MTTRKTTRKTTRPAPVPPPATTRKVIRQAHEAITSRDMLGARVVEHMKAHGIEDPWSAMNAGGICGVCGEKV